MVGDDNAFDDERLGAGLVVGLPAVRVRGAGRRARVRRRHRDADCRAVGALSGEPAASNCSPAAGSTVDNHAFTGDTGSDATLDFVRRLDRPVLEVTGSIAADATPFTRDVAVVNPTLFFAQALKDALDSARHRRGWRRGGRRRRRRGMPPRDVRRAIVSSQSPPLARHRDGHDEGEPEPVCRDAAESLWRRGSRARHDGGWTARDPGAARIVGNSGDGAHARRTVRGCRATTS